MSDREVNDSEVLLIVEDSAEDEAEPLKWQSARERGAVALELAQPGESGRQELGPDGQLGRPQEGQLERVAVAIPVCVEEGVS